MDTLTWMKKKDILHQLATRKDFIDAIRAFNADLNPIKGYSKLSKDDLANLTKKYKTPNGRLLLMVIMEIVYHRHKDFVDKYEPPKAQPIKATPKPEPKKETKAQPKPEPAKTQTPTTTQEPTTNNSQLDKAVIENLKLKIDMLNDLVEYDIIKNVLSIDKILKRNISVNDKITLIQADEEKETAKWMKRGEVLSRGRTWSTVVNSFSTGNNERFQKRIIDVLLYDMFNDIAVKYGNPNFTMSFDAYKKKVIEIANTMNYTNKLQFAKPERVKRDFEAVYRRLVEATKPAFINYLNTNNAEIEKMHTATKLYVKGHPWNLDR